MSKSKVILLNKANGIMKLLSIEYKYLNLTIDSWAIYISIPGISTITYSLWESVIKHCIDKNITWSLKFENNSLIFKIWK